MNIPVAESPSVKDTTKEKIPTPTAYFKEHGMPYNTKKAVNTKWDGQSVIYILENMVYLRHTVNFKTTTKSYKSHKTIDLPQEEWKIFENTHPAIVEKSVWDKVQELNARVVNDLIDKIKIHAPIKENGQRIQQIDIYYTAVGVIDIPQHFQEFAI